MPTIANGLWSSISIFSTKFVVLDAQAQGLSIIYFLALLCIKRLRTYSNSGRFCLKLLKPQRATQTFARRQSSNMDCIVFAAGEEFRPIITQFGVLGQAEIIIQNHELAISGEHAKAFGGDHFRKIVGDFAFHSTLMQGLKHAARDAFSEFWNDQHLSCLLYSPVFTSARLASEQAPFKRTQRRLEMICLQLSIGFAGNKM